MSSGKKYNYVKSLVKVCFVLMVYVVMSSPLHQFPLITNCPLVDLAFTTKSKNTKSYICAPIDEKFNNVIIYICLIGYPAIE